MSDNNVQNIYQYFSCFCQTYNTRNTNNISLFIVKHNFFQGFFFTSAVIECNKLDKKIALQKDLLSSKKHSWSSYVLLEALLSIAIIPKKLNYQVGWDWIWVIFMSISSSIVFKIRSTHSVAVVKILKRQLIFFLTVLIIQMKDHLSWISYLFIYLFIYLFLLPGIWNRYMTGDCNFYF